MALHPTVEQLQRGYKAFADNDLEVLSEIITEKSVWHVPGNNQLSGTYRGRDEIFGYFMKLMEMTDGTFKAELIHAVGDDDYGVAIQRSTGTRNGETMVTTDILVDRLENGVAVETWIYQENQAEIDRIFA